MIKNYTWRMHDFRISGCKEKTENLEMLHKNTEM